MQGVFQWLATVGAWCMAAGLMSAPALAAYSVYFWMRSGLFWWPDGFYAYGLMSREPPVIYGWIGLNDALQWLLDLPLAVTLPPLIIAAGRFVMWFAEDMARELARQASQP